MVTLDPATLRGDWNFPTRVRFGPGRLRELPEACRAIGTRRPLLVTDPWLAEHEIGARVLATGREAGLAVGLFSAIQPNPTGANVVAGVEAYRAGGHDGVIALGGGSGLDAAKTIAFALVQTRPLWDFEDRGTNWRGAVVDGIAPIVAIPTTAGTGSEVGRAAVITDEASHQKYILFHPKMLPGEVIADPELTLELPANLTAWTGFDALSHSLEALCAPGFHPLADGIAVEGIRLVHDWLERAVDDGHDLGARAHMLAAASMGATAFQKGLGAMHALAHPIGGHLDSHHGLTIAILMPYVLSHNRPNIEARMGRLGRALGLNDPGFEGVFHWISALRERLAIPPTIAALGVRPEHIEAFAARAVDDPTAATNPTPLDPAVCAGLYRAALGPVAAT